MKECFIRKSIKINASGPNVWNTLTKRESTDQWAAEFSSGGPRFHIESDWTPGSPVLWKDEHGTIIVEGNVTAFEENKLLRFTVFDVRRPQPLFTEKDGITYELAEQDGKTTLQITHGDFSVLTEGKKYRDLSAKVWDRVLPKIKRLAENQELEAQNEQHEYLIGN
ncbi:MAG: SRPBCC domain-containing protein [Candidatus Omnitrophica bacterium]|nr:SRPBCC domain-containing protein [Candidatus Omnitrophota bacterium]